MRFELINNLSTNTFRPYNKPFLRPSYLILENSQSNVRIPGRIPFQ
jgi:hypothetical protein